MDADRLTGDISTEIAQNRASRSQSIDVQEMQQFLAQSQAGDIQQPAPIVPGEPMRQLPPPKPLRQKAEDMSGRIKFEDADVRRSSVMRNAGEVPGAAVGGVESAVKNSLGWAINPLADWLNDHVADLRYDRKEPQTPTGAVTKSATEFLTGFIPALKALKAAGVGAMVGNTAAGAIAQFATQDPHAGRLSDLWQKLDLPKNILTDYLSSKPTDTEMESRFKNAVEGAALGPLTDGVLWAARALRGARNVKDVAQVETQYLKNKYGEVTPETLDAKLGDPTKPVIEIKPVTAEDVVTKLKKGAADTENLAPRALIRTQVKYAPGKAGPHQGQEIELMESGQKPGAMIGESEAIARGQDVPAIAEKNGWPIKVIDNGPKKDRTFLIGTTQGNLDAVDKAWSSFKVGKKPTAEQHEEMGRALGYTANDINQFLGRDQIKSQDFETYINFAKIDAPDQIKFALGKMAEAAQGTVDEARRGVITNQETEQLAEKLGMSVPDLLARRSGEAFNAEQAVAARQLWTASADKLVELAKTAAGKDASPLDQFAFRKQMAIHAAIQNEVLGARTETARALQSWSIPVKGNIERARSIDNILTAYGGTEESQKMASRIAALAENGGEDAINKIAMRGWGTATADSIKELWINGLLTNPKTHVVNVFSNSLVALNSIVDRIAGAGISAAFKTPGGVDPREPLAMTYAMISSMGDAFSLAAKALRTGESSWSSQLQKVDLPQSHALSAEGWNMSSDTTMGRFVDSLGTFVRMPGRFLAAEDDFYKTIGYRMEVAAQAVRQARSEGLSGPAFVDRVGVLKVDPPEWLRINSADAALYNTFTNGVGSFGKAVMNFRENVPAATFVLPFIRTPVNIARYAFEHTPLAPLVSQWREDIAAGGARADIALAKMSTGTAVMGTMMDLADRGLVTGPMDKGGKEQYVTEARLREGVTPYSVRVGKTWYSYNRADPFGMTMGLAANIAESVRRGEISQDEVDEWHEVTAMAIGAISNVVLNKTYLQGVSNLVEMMSDPRQKSKKYVDDLFASFVPATALMQGIKQAYDPLGREVETPWQAVEARIAGLSKNLPPKRDLWGHEQSSESGLGKFYDFLSPVAARDQKVEPVDAEMVRMNHGMERIGKQGTFDGVPANMRFYPKAYDDYVRLAGNDLKHPAWDMGAKDYLNAVVSGNHPMSTAYDTMSDESRKAFIESTVQEYRRLAQRQILDNPQHAGFAAEIAKLKTMKQDARMPFLGAQQ